MDTEQMGSGTIQHNQQKKKAQLQFIIHFKGFRQKKRKHAKSISE